jgi:hypothetical protein
MVYRSSCVRSETGQGAPTPKMPINFHDLLNGGTGSCLQWRMPLEEVTGRVSPLQVQPKLNVM